MDLPIIVTLKRPLSDGDAEITKLFFDEPTLDTQIAHAELTTELSILPESVADARATRFWISQLAGVPESVVGKLRGSDLEDASSAVRMILDIPGDTEDEAAAAGNGPPSA